MDAAAIFDAIHKRQTAGIEGSLYSKCDDAKFLVSIMPGLGLMASMMLGPLRTFMTVSILFRRDKLRNNLHIALLMYSYLCAQAVDSDRIMLIMNGTPGLPQRKELPQLSTKWFMSDGGTVDELFLPLSNCKLDLDDLISAPIIGKEKKIPEKVSV